MNWPGHCIKGSPASLPMHHPIWALAGPLSQSTQSAVSTNGSVAKACIFAKVLYLLPEYLEMSYGQGHGRYRDLPWSLVSPGIFPHLLSPKRFVHNHPPLHFHYPRNQISPFIMAQLLVYRISCQDSYVMPTTQFLIQPTDYWGFSLFPPRVSMGNWMPLQSK